MTVTGRAAGYARGVARPAAVATRGRVPDTLIAAGLVVVVTGTFLPWLRSGTTVRNSYVADGAIRQLIAPHGLAGTVLTVWPLLCLLATLALGALLTGFGRSGAALAAVSAVAAGAVAVRVLLTGSNLVLGVAPLGPVVTLAGSGSVLAVVAASLVRAALLRSAVTGAPPSHRSRRIR